ncbi:ComEC/Rec2 family competence protein [Sphingobacterium faecale]|uniref:Beta-lactamase superfamily II metal-dependent hydrolase n=1 Tax=Sphingobacterium faecale TaxID=2803775 RepID=A0ABS1R213_9SPHI|nr:hypothetical protein [Sphingobacterium faecale]MBL1408725.1 hypothetical protein [Sphingobacterium faecale]
MRSTNNIMILFLFILLGCGITKAPSDTKSVKEPPTEDVVIGKPLPHWQDGCLDIHAINTGRGESTFFIFPDGTTMLIDAAGSTIPATAPIPPPLQRPNALVSPGTVVANYVKHFALPIANKINYVMLSHFDPDHMGSYETSLPFHKSGKFQMVGITEFGAQVSFDKIIDRGYPDYNFPVDMTADPRISNYINFVDWSKKAYGATAEQFAVGRNDQILLQRKPNAYSNFEIQNICSNGVVWTGKGTDTKNTFPSGDIVAAAKGSENIFSIGIVLRYGKFNYFTAGDLQFNGSSEHSWKDIESPVAAVVPQVDMMKASHHATANCNSEKLLQKLSPHSIVIQPWRDVHPNLETVNRMIAANNNVQIFSTNMTEANKLRFGDNLKKLKSFQGHIVARISPGGDQYTIYILDDNDENYNVKEVFGPYISI